MLRAPSLTFHGVASSACATGRAAAALSTNGKHLHPCPASRCECARGQALTRRRDPRLVAPSRRDPRLETTPIALLAGASPTSGSWAPLPREPAHLAVRTPLPRVQLLLATVRRAATGGHAPSWRLQFPVTHDALLVLALGRPAAARHRHARALPWDAASTAATPPRGGLRRLPAWQRHVGIQFPLELRLRVATEGLKSRTSRMLSRWDCHSGTWRHRGKAF